jgi:hypothetical protein
MSVTVRRSRRSFTVDECLSREVDLPDKLERVDGEIGPFSDTAKPALLANWGADAVLRLTGPKIWREALAAFERSR